jgi:hypothetical protein
MLGYDGWLERRALIKRSGRGVKKVLRLYRFSLNHRDLPWLQAIRRGKEAKDSRREAFFPKKLVAGEFRFATLCPPFLWRFVASQRRINILANADNQSIGP